MSSYGYHSDHVNLIADNLRDRYKSGFPILKELIQNADDAKATRLVFGLHPGFNGLSPHPLFQGTGLWVFNDGEFKKEDERAIRSFGLNSKAGESGSIGKFGLGMKSVFHLCEAFFYVAYDGQQNVEVLLNPWRDPDGEDLFHQVWDQVSTQDFDLLRALVTKGQLDRGCKSWFLMWIPLRQRTHVPQKEGEPYGGIVDKYPGDIDSNEMQFLSNGKLSRKIRAVLPLLRHLESIELAIEGKMPGFKVQIRVDDGTRRVDHSAASLISTGSVSDGSGSKGKFRFHIQQNAMPGVIPFCQFKKLNVWPKTGRLTRDGIREPVPDKSEAEGAVLISGAPADGDEAKLGIDWAVFLPMEEGLSYEFPLQKSLQQYRIVLHGQFFVDAGRRGIAELNHLADKALSPSPELDDTDLHRGWNQSVAQQVILPQLLPTLATFSAGLNETEKEELARAILCARTRSGTSGLSKGFWESFRDFVCHDQAWVRLITPEGLKWSHEILTTDSRLLKLPPPPKHDLERAWKVLPKLRSLVNAGYLLIDEEAPCLMRTQSNWDAATLIDILDGVELDEACSETGMSYLSRFLSLEERRFVNGGDVQRKLIEMVRRMLRTEPTQSFRSIRSTFQGLVSLVRSEYRFAIGTRESEAATGLDDATFKILLSVDTEKLLLPMNLDPDKADASSGAPSEDETRNLLKSIDQEISRCIAIDSQHASNQVEKLLRASQGILKLLDDKKDERGQAIRINKSLRVLTAICARTSTNMPVAFDELQYAHKSGLLFKRQGIGHGVAAYPVASSLAKLLPAEQIWVVDAEIAGWVHRGEQNALAVPSADDTSAACAALGKLGRTMALADMLTRSTFLRNNIPSNMKGDDVVRGIRYVLHGSTIHHADSESTLWINADSAAEIWVKLKRMIAPDSWNVVDSSLTGQIKRDDRELLGIREIAADEVIALMRDGGVAQIAPSQLTDHEWVHILNKIPDQELWRALPVHRDSVGNLGPVDGNCFIDPSGLARAEVSKGVRLIVLSGDSHFRKRQEQWIPTWTQATTIERVLAQAAPGLHWEMILGSLTDASLSSVNAESALRTTKWLPLTNGGHISPEDVIDLEPLADDIERMASQCGYRYSGVLAISKAVQNHGNFQILRSLFSRDKYGLERLGKLMGKVDGYLVGDSSLTDKFDTLIDSLATLKSLPAWALVKSAIAVVGMDRISDVIEYLVKEIRKPLDVEKLVVILNEISSQGNSKLNPVFNLYLSQLVQYSDDLPSDLTKIRLLARDGNWKTPGELCVGVQGVVGGSILLGEQELILEGYLQNQGAGSLARSRIDESSQSGDDAQSLVGQENAQTTLLNYFKPWRELMPSGPVGAFFALLGPKFRSLAAEWLDPYSFDYLADSLSWIDPGSRNSPVWDYQQKYSKLDALDMLDFLPAVTASKHVTVSSLLGHPISVDVDHKVIDGLVVGTIALARKSGRRATFNLPLRQITLSGAHNTASLANLLRKTCECILHEAYNQRAPDLSSLWETLAKSEQLELEIAHEMILEGLHHELFKLDSVKKNKALSDWQKAFKRLEKDRAAKIAGKKAIDQIDKAIAAVKANLAHLMKVDSKVQYAVLTGIRKRVEQNRYEVSSIAFEILQNADDAVTELQRLRIGDSGTPHPSAHVGRFVMETDGDMVRFMHWGRPINHVGHGSARNESYEDDLKHMLVLAASEKDDSIGLTGKFGLGFKSVLLATDEPCLLSGDLAVKIVGGCLPIQWTEASKAVLALSMNRSPEAQGLRGTAVEFKVNSIEKRSQVLDRFTALAGLQCVFSKEIRSIKINETIHQWLPKPLAVDLSNVEFDTVQLSSNGGIKPSHVLNFRLADGCFALRVGSRGFIPFQEDVDNFAPGIWVTAPTREPAATGLILNCQFKLDTGRGGLPHGESANSNLAMAAQVGALAADLVLQATRASRRSWDHVRSLLKLSRDVTEAEFWATFWEQIPLQKVDEGEANRLLNQFGHSLRERFIRVAEEIPNGLSGDLARFVNPAAACLALNARWEKLFAVLSNWPALVACYPVSGWVSANVAAQLKATRANEEVEILGVSVELLLDLVPNNGCTAEVAVTLADLFESLSSLEEERLVKERMADFVFEAKDGSWHFGKSLLKAGRALDEQYLPFAPTFNALHSLYQAGGLELVHKYVSFEVPHPDVIAGWILAAPPDPHLARIAALRCLLGSPNVRHWVGVKIPGSWIEGVDARSPYLLGFTVQEKNQLLVMFKTEPVWEVDDVEEPEQEPGPELKVGNQALRAIFDWWRENKVEQLRKFDREFWPAGIPRKFDSTTENRSSWMTLFALGLMQRHGRVQDSQNRGFIDKMQSKRFWDVFTTVDPREDGQAWIDILTAYGDLQDEDEEYSMWMDNFPRIYRVARWFDVYTQVFLGLDYRDNDQTNGMLSPNTDSVMSGSGQYAPSVRRSLKLGHHVVVRELLRCNVIHGESATALAFKPGTSVKNLFSLIGLDQLNGNNVESGHIYKVLHEGLGENATFGGDYDIPLIIMARNFELQLRILGASASDESEFDDNQFDQASD